MSRENDNEVWEFEIRIRKGGNGIHEYLKMDIQSLDQADENEIEILGKIHDLVLKYNKEEIEHA